MTNKGWPRWQQLIRTASAQAALENEEILDLLFQLNPLGKFEEITFVHKHIPLLVADCVCIPKPVSVLVPDQNQSWCY